MDYKIIYEQLFQISKMAGIIAVHLQKDIVNEGKVVEHQQHEDVYHKAMREAKTKVDVMVQELFLQMLYPEYHNVVTLDVEEESDYVQQYQNDSYTYTLVLDPIDGTLDYIHQKDTYSICSAILHDGDVKVAMVYFPARDELYGYYEGGCVQYYKHLTHCHVHDGKPFSYTLQKQEPKIIYKNSRLSSIMVQQLLDKGFQVIDDQKEYGGCPQALLKCMSGDAFAYVSDTRNIRDILLGAILSKLETGTTCNYKGEAVLWETHGRQKEIIFTVYDKNLIF